MTAFWALSHRTLGHDLALAIEQRTWLAA